MKYLHIKRNKYTLGVLILSVFLGTYFTALAVSHPVSNPLSINPTSAKVKVGGMVRLQANYQPVTPCPDGKACIMLALAPYQVAAKWTSNSKVATVEYGVVTGISAGDATITATYTDSSGVVSTASALVRVLDDTTSVSNVLFINPTSAIVKVGGSATLQASYQPSMPPCPVGNSCIMIAPAPYLVQAKWTSNSKVATITSSGVVTGVSAGTATITATFTEFGVSSSVVHMATATVTVVGTTNTGSGPLSINPANARVKIGGSTTLRASYQPVTSCPDGKACIMLAPAPYTVQATWTSSNSKVASVTYKSNCPTGALCARFADPTNYLTAVVTGVSAGTATITATYTDSSGVVSTASALISVEQMFGINPPPFQPSVRTFVYNLRVGSRSDDVMELQQKLQSLGYFSQSEQPTGYFGRITRAAVIKFQEENGIPATGFVGPLTREELNK
ncbi:MAG: peptidoglycan-binding protein [Patescibacteria group bacterium]